MMITEPRRSAIHRPPPSIDARELLRRLGALSSRPSVLDVREEALFRAGHIEGSIHAPDSATTGLLKKIANCSLPVLVCDDGRLSSNVVRMLGVCGFPEVTYLDGGLQAWTQVGGPLYELTRSGNECRVSGKVVADPPGAVARLLGRLAPRVLLASLAGAASILGGLSTRLHR